MVNSSWVATQSLRKGLAACRTSLGDRSPAGAVLFTCVNQDQEFFGNRARDPSLVTRMLGTRATSGFYGLGEVGPVEGMRRRLALSAVAGVFPGELADRSPAETRRPARRSKERGVRRVLTCQQEASDGAGLVIAGIVVGDRTGVAPVTIEVVLAQRGRCAADVEQELAGAHGCFDRNELCLRDLDGGVHLRLVIATAGVVLIAVPSSHSPRRSCGSCCPAASPKRTPYCDSLVLKRRRLGRGLRSRLQSGDEVERQGDEQCAADEVADRGEDEVEQ